MKLTFAGGALAALLSLLTACTHMSGVGGDATYACKAPEGVACDSVSGTYANAVHDNLPAQRTRRSTFAAAADDRVATAIRRGTPPSDPATTVDDGVGPNTAPQSLRSPVRILRLWVKPWEDADGDLVDQGYVYVKVDNGDWLLDHVQARIRDVYAPLKAPPASTGAAAESRNGTATTPLPVRTAPNAGGAPP